MRSAFEHALVMTLRDALTREGQPISRAVCYVQDPVFTEVEKSIFSEHGIAVVDDPQAFLEIDESSVVLSRAPNVPVKQIVLDIARPAIIIWIAIDPEKVSKLRW